MRVPAAVEDVLENAKSFLSFEREKEWRVIGGGGGEGQPSTHILDNTNLPKKPFLIWNIPPKVLSRILYLIP